MTIITIHGDNITFKGHANYSDKGYDIVCSAISNLSRTLVSFSDDFVVGGNDEDIEISVFKARYEFLEFIIRALLILEEEFPNYVKVVIE